MTDAHSASAMSLGELNEALVMTPDEFSLLAEDSTGAEFMVTALRIDTESGAILFELADDDGNPVVIDAVEEMDDEDDEDENA